MMSREPAMFLPKLTPFNKVDKMVEHRTAFTVNDCELHVYETFEAAEKVELGYQDWALIGMLRGKKVMHFYEDASFDYLPGQILSVAPDQKMEIDFPDAHIQNPTQCMVITISNKLINRMESVFYKTTGIEAQLNLQHFHLYDNSVVSNSVNQLTKIMMEENRTTKDTIVHAAMQDLFLRLLQIQNRKPILKGGKGSLGAHPFGDLIDFIKNNLAEDITIDKMCSHVYMSRAHFYRQFKRIFGMPPMDFVIRERISAAKMHLISASTVTETAYKVGFKDVNFFIRTFKKLEGVTPKKYQISSIQ